ncbi:MAG: tryptophan--tRNA ligase [Proteobacteria bacterium]|nr:tryptophan--tRNA ligase [Pseudomonadota bacterium]
MKTSLTGIKPTGVPHLGNYFGAIKPALELAQQHRSLYFVADYHALTNEKDPTRLRRSVYDVTAAWLACGLDPERTLLYRQSAVGEVFELAWVFACVVATGQLERGHSYKDALAKGASANAGLFNYPLLMAADIILYDADIVPVGRDQLQHLELARDAAIRVNHLFGQGTLVVPEARLTGAPVVAGLDGRKMSKSYDNTLPLFASAKALRSAVMRIKTDSTPLQAEKSAEGATPFELYKLVAAPDQVERMAARLHAGGYGWGHAKQDLFEALESAFAPMRQRYEQLRGDEPGLDAILEDGACRARQIASRTMARVRAATGIGPLRS